MDQKETIVEAVPIVAEQIIVKPSVGTTPKTETSAPGRSQWEAGKQSDPSADGLTPA
jgi:hypothetical protein